MHLDVLRAIAALMVIGYHTDGLIVGPNRADGLWLRYNLDTGVELFFVLSGYLIAITFLRALVAGDVPPDTRSFARRRAARILPGYWLALGVAAFVATRQPGALPPPGLLLPQGALLQGLIPGDTGGPLVVAWTLSIEAAFYVGVPIATWLLLMRRRSWSVSSLAVMTLMVWAISACVACVVAALFPTSPWSTVVLRGPVGLMGQFCPGILIALLQIHSERARTSVPTRVGWMLIARWDGCSSPSGPALRPPHSMRWHAIRCAERCLPWCCSALFESTEARTA